MGVGWSEGRERTGITRVSRTHAAARSCDAVQPTQRDSSPGKGTGKGGEAAESSCEVTGRLRKRPYRPGGKRAHEKTQERKVSPGPRSGAAAGGVEIKALTPGAPQLVNGAGWGGNICPVTGCRG